jgi:hypothetical protein
MIKCLINIEQAGRSMKLTRFLAVFSILLVTFVVSASAQKSKRPAPRATPTPARPYVNPVVSVAKTQVSNQLYNVNVFVDRLGPIAVMIENADKEAAAGRLKKEYQDSNNVNKQKTVAAIRGLRDGLVTLETDFRTKAPLSPYLSKIQGIGALCSQSEDKAIAGQFVAAKDPLRQVAQKLNDTLASMPGIVAGEGYSAPQNTTVPVSNTSSNRTLPASSTTQGTSRTSEPKIGMTAAEVLQTSWGTPNAKRTSTSSNGNTEVWMYSGARSVYFFNGKVTNIVK